MPGVMWSKYSITVTFEPNLAQTDPISRPIYPPPMMTKLFGTFSKDNAPVDETIFYSSIIIPFIGTDAEPVAITIFFAL